MGVLFSIRKSHDMNAEEFGSKIEWLDCGVVRSDGSRKFLFVANVMAYETRRVCLTTNGETCTKAPEVCSR